MSQTSPDMIKFVTLARTLYIELIIDGAKGCDRKNVEKFLPFFDGVKKGTITEANFQNLYQIWLESKSNKKSSEIRVPLTMFLDIVKDIPYQKLDMYIGILNNIHNRTYLSKYSDLVSTEWIKEVESMFFMLDSDGNGAISPDEMIFFILSLLRNQIENPSDFNFSPEQLFLRTKQFMDVLGTFEGVITLKRFKEYFIISNLDLESIQDTRYSIKEAVEKNNGVINCWKSVIHSINEHSQNISFQLINYLLHDSHQVRHAIMNDLFVQGVSALQNDFISKVGQVDDIGKLQELLNVVLESYRAAIKELIDFNGKSIQNRQRSELQSPPARPPPKTSPPRPKPTPQQEPSHKQSAPTHNQESEHRPKPTPVQTQPTPVNTTRQTSRPTKQERPLTPVSELVSEYTTERYDFRTTQSVNSQHEIHHAHAFMLPFDVDTMIRNAEWEDIKPSNVEYFKYLEVRTGTELPSYEEMKSNIREEIQSQYESSHINQSGDVHHDYIPQQPNPLPPPNPTEQVPTTSKTNEEVPKTNENVPSQTNEQQEDDHLKDIIRISLAEHAQKNNADHLPDWIEDATKHVLKELLKSYNNGTNDPSTTTNNPPAPAESTHPPQDIPKLKALPELMDDEAIISVDKTTPRPEEPIDRAPEPKYPDEDTTNPELLSKNTKDFHNILHRESLRHKEDDLAHELEHSGGSLDSSRYTDSVTPATLRQLLNMARGDDHQSSISSPSRKRHSKPMKRRKVQKKTQKKSPATSRKHKSGKQVVSPVRLSSVRHSRQVRGGYQSSFPGTFSDTTYSLPSLPKNYNKLLHATNSTQYNRNNNAKEAPRWKS